MTQIGRRERLRHWYEHAFLPWYARWAPAAVAMCMAIATIAIVATYFTSRAQEQERAARVAVIGKLLECFDTYAARSSTSSIAVREATVAKDDATETRDHALKREGVAFLRVARQILHQDVTPAAFRDLEQTLAERAKAARVLAKAQRHLDKVRADNPVPKPPSQFCSVQP